jgi:hypothetical protein
MKAGTLNNYNLRLHMEELFTNTQKIRYRWQNISLKTEIVSTLTLFDEDLVFTSRRVRGFDALLIPFILEDGLNTLYIRTFRCNRRAFKPDNKSQRKSKISRWKQERDSWNGF